MVRDVTPAIVEEEKAKTRLLFVDCWAPWCQPCLALGPVLEELDEKYKSNPDVGFLKVNTQDHREYAAKYNITAIPCVLIFIDGSPAQIEVPVPNSDETTTIDRLIGLRPPEHYESVIELVLKQS